MKRVCVLLGLIVVAGCAGTSTNTPSNWVEDTLHSMSIEQKVGQMMVPAFVPRFYNRDDGQFKRLLTLVQKYNVGGMMFFRGDPYEVAYSIDRLQEVAKLPLLIMADIEWGLAMRVDDATRFPQNMAVGATRRADYAYEIGRITAAEAKAIGVHIGYAPVMDVNNNPDNIIINTRSFGETPELVSRLGAAFIRGMQENGVFATAKHFPGHGDTNVDSHLDLPVITATSQRIRNVELRPFKAAVDAGVKCVMVAHITYSDFPQMQGRPATLDSYFIQKVLRKEMGFDGLVFTDAMDMRGITGNYWAGEAAVMAINAGVDMVLIPPFFETTFQFVVKAVREGRISETRLDASVRRILRAKLAHGLNRRPQFDRQRLEDVLADPAHLQKATEISDASMTLIRDRQNVLPLQAEEVDSVLVVTISDDPENVSRGDVLAKEVAKRVPVVRSVYVDPRTTAAEMAEVITTTDSAEAIVVGAFVKWGSYKGSVTLPDTTAALLRDLFDVPKPMAVIAFGSPYILRQIPDAPSYLCAYETVPLAVQSAVKAIFGEIPLQANLPVSIPGFYDMGTGLSRAQRTMTLVKAIDDVMLEPAYQVLRQAIADSIFPGAQVTVVRDGKIIASRCFGRQTYDPQSPPVTPETIYDLASVTKVVGTTVTAMHLWERGRLLLDIPIKSYLPKFTGGAKDSVTFRHLLTHSAGAHWWVDLWNKAHNKQEALDYIYQLPLDYTPGDSMIYSDLGLIMAGEIISTVTGQPLDQLYRQRIHSPLGMNNTMYNPPKSLLGRIAPTEIGGSMNRGLIHGDVHDENTFFLNGVSSHAGLFSTAEDLAILAQMLINGGIYKHQRFFSPATIREWTRRQNMPPGSSRAIGWDTPSDHNSSAGDYFSKGSFGHTGFTGTSFWVDPNNRIAIILLTNRVHPTRERGGMHKVRRDFHNAAMKALLAK